MPPKKKAAKAAPVAVVVESQPAFTPAEAKKLAKLLKGSDRGKRLDAIRVVSENHAYIATGDCLLPLLESLVPKKKTEDVVKAVGQVITDYLVGRDGGDPSKAKDTTLSAMQEAAKKPSKYKMAEVLSNLLHDRDRGNSWNAVRCLRAMAAVVASLPVGSSQEASIGDMLLGPGRPVERVSSYLVAQETQRAIGEAKGTGTANKDGEASGADATAPWTTARLHVVDTLGVMCGLRGEAIRTLVATGAVFFLLEILRFVTASNSPDLPLLASVLIVLSAVAKAGAREDTIATRRRSADEGHLPTGEGKGALALAAMMPAVATTTTTTGGEGSEPAAELAALEAGGTWGAVYDALKGPCMARAAELQSGTKGKRGAGGAGGGGSVSTDLAMCLDNMARCAEVLRVMAITSAGLEEGALESGITLMSSILAMQGLPRGDASVANLMTSVAKAIGSIACLSESNRVKVCSTGAAVELLALMKYADVSIAGADALPPDTPHVRMMRKTAEKCLHHLLVSRVTWLADDRALCDTSTDALPEQSGVSLASSGTSAYPSTGGKGLEGAASVRRGSGSRRESRSDRNDRVESFFPPAQGPAHLPVDAILAVANVESVDVRCRTIRLMSRLVSSRRCTAALGAAAVPALGRIVAWWLRTRDDPEAHRTPRASAADLLAVKSSGAKKGAKSAALKATTSKDTTPHADEAAQAAERLACRKLDESDSTKVLRDEALAYSLNVMLELARTGPNERTAVGEDVIVGLLSDVLKRFPCTSYEFCANNGCLNPATDGEDNAGVRMSKPSGAAEALDLPADGSGQTTSPQPIAEQDYTIGAGHAPSRTVHGHFSETEVSARQIAPERSHALLDLSSTRASYSGGSSPRRLYSWRGEHCRDPEVKLFSPLDWGWDFRLVDSQGTVQPAMILRATALRVLLAVADGYCPRMETAALEVDVSLKRPSKARGAVVGDAAQAFDVSGVAGARSVLKHTMTVCVDLLTVDVCYGTGDTETSNATEGDVVYGSHNTTGQAASGPALEAPSGACISGGQEAAVTVDDISGSPVSPSNELVHEEIRLACLRLLGSLLRLGDVAREAFLSVADTHRNIWRTILGDPADSRSLQPTTPMNVAKPTGKGDKAPGGAAAASEGESRIKLNKFSCWDFRDGYDSCSLRAALPFVRAVSLFLLPLRNPDAPIVDIMAALAGLQRLCREGDHEAGGTQPEPSGPDDGVAPFPMNREATTGTLVDTFAGVAISMGALVPLLVIWDCATTAPAPVSNEISNEGEELLAQDCLRLIDYLILRGHCRESFWSSLPSLEQISEAKSVAAKSVAAKAVTPKKTKGKSKAVQKETDKGCSLNTPSHENKEVQECAPRPSLSPAGRPDPNFGPDRATWGRLLNARADDQRTKIKATTALLMATNTGLEEAVTSLLLAGADPNARERDGRSSLMCALAQGMDNSARRLVEAGADVDAMDLQGSNVLMYAFLSPSRKTMQLIRQHSEDLGDVEMTSATSALGSGVWCGLDNGPRGSTTRTGDIFSKDENTSYEGRPRSRTRRGSLATSRSRSHSLSRSRSNSGSLTRERRRSSLNRRASFGGETPTATGSSDRRRRLSRTPSMSLTDSVREALRSCGRERSVFQLKTPEGVAIVRGDARMVPYILAYGADPNVSNGSGDFPLHWSVLGTEITVKIMKQRVRIVACGDCGESNAAGTTSRLISNGEGVTKAAEERGLENFILRDQLSLLNVLVEAGSVLDARNKEGMTALHAAVIAGHKAPAEWLLDAGSSPNVLDSTGCLPLHYACLRAAKGYVDLARRLLNLGMGRRLDRGIYRDDRKGKTRQEKLLLDVGNILREGLLEATAPSSITQHRITRSELLNFVSAAGFAPLHCVCDALEAGHIVSTGAAARRVIGSNDAQRWPPPADSGTDRVEMMKWLLSEPELDPRVRLSSGATALHLAAQASGALGGSIVLTLIQEGVIDIDALDIPVGSYHRVAAHIFRDDSASVSERPSSQNKPDIKLDGSSTPLRFSALHYALEASAWETAALLFSAGASIQLEDAFPSCLHVACLAGAPTSLVKRLLDKERESSRPGANQNLGESSSGNTAQGQKEHYIPTPLFLAAAAGSAEIIELLVLTSEATDPAVGCQSVWSTQHSPGDGRSPLHAAALGGHPAAVRALLKAEARSGQETSSSWLNTFDAAGRTPLDLAVAAEHWECAEMLTVTDGFDVALAVGGGASSALFNAERANMAIVDEGSGEASALDALRESNSVIMALLKRLSDWTETAEMTGSNGEVLVSKATGFNAGDERETIAESVKEPTDSPAFRLREQDGGDEPGDKRPSPHQPSSVIHHAHPCFAEGVLYSNAKGAFVPDSSLTPDSSQRRRSTTDYDDPYGWRDIVAATAEHHRAAVIIQSLARQAYAKKVAAAKRLMRDRRET